MHSASISFIRQNHKQQPQIRCCTHNSAKNTTANDRDKRMWVNEWETVVCAAVHCYVCRCFEYGRNISKVVGCVISNARLHICVVVIIAIKLNYCYTPPCMCVCALCIACEEAEVVSAYVYVRVLVNHSHCQTPTNTHTLARARGHIAASDSSTSNSCECMWLCHTHTHTHIYVTAKVHLVLYVRMGLLVFFSLLPLLSSLLLLHLLPPANLYNKSKANTRKYWYTRTYVHKIHKQLVTRTQTHRCICSHRRHDYIESKTTRKRKRRRRRQRRRQRKKEEEPKKEP